MLRNEKEVRKLIESSAKHVKDGYVINPIIYHRIVKVDSIINYFYIVRVKKDAANSENKLEFSFVQDPLYLLLDKKLPDFKLKDMNGNKFSSDQLLGKPSLLNFWFIGCKPCMIEIPELNMLKERYGDKLNFIGFALNEANEVKEFLEKQPFNYYMLPDARNYSNDLKIKGYPKNIFIDKHGYVRYIQGNFPYTKIDIQSGQKEYEENNYFIKIIETLLKNDN